MDPMSPILPSLRTGDLRPLGAVVRALLTLTAVAVVLLALQSWALGPPHNHHRSAGELALVFMASGKVLGALALAGVALYLATRPKRAFQRILLMLTVLAGIIAMAAHQPALIAIAVGDCLAALLAASLWPEIGDPRSSRAGWLLLCAATGVTAWLLLLQDPDRRMAFLFTLLLVLAFVAVVSGLALLDRNPPLPAAWDLPAATSLYEAHARSGVAPFALMRDKRHFWAHDHRSFLAFGCRAGTALALGPAIGPGGSAGELQEEFRAACLRRGWRPAFYQVSEKTARELPSTVHLGIGSEAFVELESFGLEGPEMAKLRRDVARAGREGVSIEVLPESGLSHELRSELGRLEEETVGRQRLGAMSFSVGHGDDPPLVERTVGLAHDRNGGVAGFVTWLWLPAATTIVLDKVVRRPDAPPGAMDLLITTCLQEFRGRAERASLGLAPMTGGGHAARLAVAETFLRRVFGISSLAPGVYSFKAKFNPTWEQRYLVVDRVLDLAPVLVATFLLHYPELTRRLQSLSRPRLVRA
jgi:phosphatidylglycerol lysyltransferase